MAVDEERLACGRLVDQVWQGIDLPPDEHEASCPDCADARERLGVLSRATRDLAESDRNDPDMSPASRVTANILEVARAEVRRGQLLPLRQDQNRVADESLRISEQAIAAIVRATADTMAGLHARRCRISVAEGERHGPLESVTVRRWQPARVLVRLSVSMSASAVIPELIDELRRRVISRIDGEVGVEVDRIDVVVEDVHDA